MQKAWKHALIEVAFESFKISKPMKNNLRNTLLILFLLAVSGLPLMIGCDSGDNGSDNNPTTIGTATDFFPLPQTTGQTTKLYFRVETFDTVYSGTDANNAKLNPPAITDVVINPLEVDIKKNSSGYWDVTSPNDPMATTIKTEPDGSITWTVPITDAGSPAVCTLLKKDVVLSNSYIAAQVTGGTGTTTVESYPVTYTDASGTTHQNVVKLVFTYTYTGTETWSGPASVALADAGREMPLNVPVTYTKTINENGKFVFYLAKSVGLVGMEGNHKAIKATTKGSGTAVAYTLENMRVIASKK